MMLMFHTAAAPYKRAGKGLPEARLLATNIEKHANPSRLT